MPWTWIFSLDGRVRRAEYTPFTVSHIRSVFRSAPLTLVLASVDLYSAQQPTKIARIGYLSAAASLSTISARTEAFRQGLRAPGYVEGKNVVVEWRSAAGKTDRLPGLAAELVRLKVHH